MEKPVTTEKVTEAAMKRSIISSVIGILLCLLCLSGTTWAWYSSSVESGENETFGANFDFNVVINKIETSEFGETVTPDENGVYTFNFNGGVDNVTLTKAGTAEKGFCKVIATKSGENSETTSYYIVDFTNNNNDSISFTVTGSGTLKLIPMLGTPSETYTEIPEGGIVLTPDPEPAEYDSEEEEIEEEELEEEPEEKESSEEKITDEDASTNSEPVETEPTADPTTQIPLDA